MKNKIVKVLSLLIVAMLVFAGCSSKPASNDGKTTEGNGAEGNTTEEPKVKVGLVVSGGLGDRSFYDSSNEGLESAIKNLGVEGKVLECKNDPSLLSDQLVQASNYGDIIVVVGFEFYDVIQEIAPQFPTKTYVYVDNAITGIDNIVSIQYKENEGSFLAGALAAMLSETGHIGMVGGVDLPVIRNFQVGYEEGAKYINSDIKIDVIFAGDFEDPTKGKESAMAIYNKGADIIFHAAGKTGEGVFEAGKDLGKYAIGVDSDQRYINPEVIMYSMIKNVGLSVYETIENIGNGSVKGGEILTYGIKENGIGIGYGTSDMKQFVTDEMKSKLEEITEKIVNGEIKVTEAR